MPDVVAGPLRFGVMCSGPALEAAFAASVRELSGTEGVELALVIEDAQEWPAPRARRSLWDAYLQRRPLHTISCNEPVDLTDVFAGVPRARARDVESIRSHGLDFILVARRVAGCEALIDVPTHGVWSFHHSDEPRSRRGPPGFWEIYLGEPSTGAILQRLTQRPDLGVVLQRSFASTKLSSYRTTLDAAAWAGTFMPARVARDILRGSADYLDAPPSATGPPVAQPPTNARTARFLARMALAWVKAHLYSIFVRERWHVGIVRQPIESFLREGFEPAIEWLPHRARSAYLADPFLAAAGTTNRLLMERWDYRSGRGSIVEVDLEEGLNGRAPSTVLGGRTHMSYPFVFEHDGKVVCAPESFERRGVSLYVLDGNGRGWREHGRVLDGVAALDPTLIRHDGRWWLFCTDEDDGPMAKLQLWSAPELLGPWEPHPGNPVKADVRSSRPAGTPFVHQGELYRPAQDCSGSYGAAVVINRVTRLTTAEYAEEPVARYSPPPGSSYGAGAHTLAGLGGLTAVDGKRRELVPRLVRRRVARKLGRFVAKRRGRT